MATATVPTSAASQPVSLFCTPSSRSIISAARFSASSLTSAAGWCSRATSSVMAPPTNEKAPPASWTGLARSAFLVELHAFLGEVLHRARMPGQRRGVLLLVLELEVLGFLVHPDQLVAMVEDRLDDVVGGLVVQLLVRDQDVHHGRLLVVLLHAAVDILGDGVLDVQVAVLLVHCRHEVGVVDHLDLDPRRVREVGHRRRRQATHPEE